MIRQVTWRIVLRSISLMVSSWFLTLAVEAEQARGRVGENNAAGRRVGHPAVEIGAGISRVRLALELRVRPIAAPEQALRPERSQQQGRSLGRDGGTDPVTAGELHPHA